MVSGVGAKQFKYATILVNVLPVTEGILAVDLLSVIKIISVFGVTSI